MGHAPLPSCSSQGCSCDVNVADSDCIDLSGDGSAGSPVVATPIIPTGAVVPHPLAPGFLPDTENGATCSPTGLMAPQPGYPSGSQDDIAIGSLPDIVADQAATAWGPILSNVLTNLNADRFDLIMHALVHPIVTMTLEPGAAATYGYIFDPSGLAIFIPLWGMSNNSGAAIEVYQQLPQTGINGPFFFAPSGVSTIEYQSWVATSGFGGSSSVTSLGQSGLGIRQWGVPL